MTGNALPNWQEVITYWHHLAIDQPSLWGKGEDFHCELMRLWRTRILRHLHERMSLVVNCWHQRSKPKRYEGQQLATKSVIDWSQWKPHVDFFRASIARSAQFGSFNQIALKLSRETHWNSVLVANTRQLFAVCSSCWGIVHNLKLKQFSSYFT